MGTVGASKHGCLRSHSRGYKSKAGCPNQLSVPKPEIEQAVIATIRNTISDADLWKPIVFNVMLHLHVSTFSESSELESLRTELRTTENHVARLTEALAERGTSGSILVKLDAEEARIVALKASIRSKARHSGSVPPVRTEDVIAAFENSPTWRAKTGPSPTPRSGGTSGASL
jgi:hypothetical protein